MIDVHGRRNGCFRIAEAEGPAAETQAGECLVLHIPVLDRIATAVARLHWIDGRPHLRLGGAPRYISDQEAQLLTLPPPILPG
jgi:hypothetical protein